MKNKLQRDQELLNSGLIDSIKELFQNSKAKIPQKYYILMADYIDCIGQLDYKGGLYLDPVTVAKKLPTVINEIKEEDLAGIHGITNDKSITMNSSLTHKPNKLYFFHELTHALQTRKVGNHEECGFYNGKTGMFLTEGITQYTAEILYNLSNDTDMRAKKQQNTVRGLAEHTTYSPLSEYQLNGNILMLLSGALGVPLNQLLALGFRKDGRQILKEMYESFSDNEGKFEGFMFDLEKIYYLDKLIISKHKNQLQKGIINIQIPNSRYFSGNIESYGKLINKIEWELATMFLTNNNIDYILENYRKISLYLTTSELKQDFTNTIAEIASLQNGMNTNQKDNHKKQKIIKAVL